MAEMHSTAGQAPAAQSPAGGAPGKAQERDCGQARLRASLNAVTRARCMPSGPMTSGTASTATPPR